MLELAMLFKRIFILLLVLLIFLPSFCFGEKRRSERGIYITAYTAQSPQRFGYLRKRAKESGLNTLVIDAKEILRKNFLVLVKERQLKPDTKVEASPWLSKLTKELHAEGFIVTARIVVFKDDHLIIARPDLAVRVGGGLYRDHKGGRWADPYADEVRLYNAMIAESAAASGVDEIQFDYIRFPAEGNALRATYPENKEKLGKVDAICRFLKEVRERVNRYNVSLALDIFGITAWQSKYDIDNLGQDLKKMAPYLDVLSPMFYPSHFHAGYDGFSNPGSHPYYFVNTGIKKAKEILSQESTVLVPWIQGFNMKSPNYGTNYILEQIRAGKEAGVEGFLIWNASNNYETAFRALKN